MSAVLRVVAIGALMLVAIGCALWFFAGLAVTSDSYFETGAGAELFLVVLAVGSVGALLAAVGLIAHVPALALWGAVGQAVATIALLVVFERSALEGDDPTPWRLGFGLVLLVDAYAAYRGWRPTRREVATR